MRARRAAEAACSVRRAARACCRSISLMPEAPREARSAAASLGSGEADLKKRVHGGRTATPLGCTKTLAGKEKRVASVQEDIE